MVTPENVAGQHVAGALQAVETAIDRARQSLRQGGLAHAGDVFDEQMAARQQAYQAQTQYFRLTANRQRQVRFELCELGPSDLRGVHGFPLGHYCYNSGFGPEHVPPARDSGSEAPRSSGA